jgi:hypothetical protein
MGLPEQPAETGKRLTLQIAKKPQTPVSAPGERFSTQSFRSVASTSKLPQEPEIGITTREKANNDEVTENKSLFDSNGSSASVEVKAPKRKIILKRDPKEISVKKSLLDMDAEMENDPRTGMLGTKFGLNEQSNLLTDNRSSIVLSDNTGNTFKDIGGGS